MAEQQVYTTQLTNGVGTISGTVCLRAYNSNRQSLMLQNLGTSNLYVGGSAVGTANGIKVAPDGDITLDKSRGAALYCMSDGTIDIRFLEEII